MLATTRRAVLRWRGESRSRPGTIAISITVATVAALAVLSIRGGAVAGASQGDTVRVSVNGRGLEAMTTPGNPRFQPMGCMSPSGPKLRTWYRVPTTVSPLRHRGQPRRAGKGNRSGRVVGAGACGP